MNFTPKQLTIIQQARTLMPEMFSVNTEDIKILAYAEVVLSDINLFPPLTGFTTESVPDIMLPVLYFGICLFAELFLQMNATLQDFEYNDNGLSVRVDQVGKINQSYINMLEVYKNMITNFKKTQIFAVGGAGISTPRYQSQIGQFLKISLGCLLPNTRVQTSSGNVLIQDIQIGDFVLSMDGNYHKVYDILTRKVYEEIYSIRVADRVFSVTGNHEILTTNSWVSADHLKIGDVCFVDEKLKLEKVRKITCKSYKGLVYDLSVENTHSYNADGVIIHNSAFTWNSPG